MGKPRRSSTPCNLEHDRLQNSTRRNRCSAPAFPELKSIIALDQFWARLKKTLRDSRGGSGGYICNIWRKWGSPAQNPLKSGHICSICTEHFLHTVEVTNSNPIFPEISSCDTEVCNSQPYQAILHRRSRRDHPGVDRLFLALQAQSPWLHTCSIQFRRQAGLF